MTKTERLEKQLQRLTEMKRREEELHAHGYVNIAGVDEVGRGPLAGPVVAAAVVLPEDFNIPGIDDSKKLSEKKREELFHVIKEKAVACGIGMADHKVIDDINILQATKIAMREAVSEVENNLKKQVKNRYSDCDTYGTSRHEDYYEEHTGLDYILFDAMKIDEIQTPQESVIKGDSKILAIAAASIIAKVTRDKMMIDFAKVYPGYGFEKNKGYGTKQHYEGIEKHGICPIHRRSFLKKIL